MRKTKIVCTIGPATDDENVMRRLILAGMNVARVNFSHGTYDEHYARIEAFKLIREELEMPVALMLDTKGPEVRIKQFASGRVELKEGAVFTLAADDVIGDQNRVSITYSKLARDIAPGDAILVDDGAMELRVSRIVDNDIVCQVVNDGVLSDNKSINIPGSSLRLPFVSKRDREDVLFGIDQDFDFVAASFSRNATDINDLRAVLRDNDGLAIKIVAKIENREGVDNIEEIIRAADGIMVARGDMGVEIPYEELPALQKKIIEVGVSSGKPVITATQMLDSMIRNPRPTRAEITDVANAVYDGTSALMLSGETAVGKYPVEAVQTMEKIALNTEMHIKYEEIFENTKSLVSGNIPYAISHSTCAAAHSLDAAAIISVTRSGQTAKNVSMFRPACPIIAATISDKVYRQLGLSWGVVPLLTQEKFSTDDIFHQAIEESERTGLVKNGDLVVITGGTPAGISGTTSTLRVHIIGNVLVEGEGINQQCASGPVCVLNEIDDMKRFNAGDIMVVAETTDEILPVLKYASAIVTEEPLSTSKAAVVGRALEIPVMTSAQGATRILKSGTVVTVDSEKGMVFAGAKKNQNRFSIF